MSGEQPAGEKSFAPTEKRKRDAAKKGDVLRSKEVATAVAIFVGGSWLMLGGDWLLDSISETAQIALQFDRPSLDHFAPRDLILTVMGAILPPVLLFGLCILIATTASQLFFGEGRWIASNLKLKGSRINPLSGFKRMFGAQGLIELGKSLLKVGLLGGIAAWWAYGRAPNMLGIGRGELKMQLVTAWETATTLMMALAFGLAIIALIDWPIQFARRMKRLKMTHKEMRDEAKESEGSPERKAAQRQRQRDFARGGVAVAMEQAQFVLTNPSHFSVALSYDPTLAPAPIVVAKGRGEKAFAMREIAAEKALPILEYPMLARSVYFTTRERQIIREELYVAVAALVAFIMSLKRGEHPPYPNIEVPIALRFDSEGRTQQA